MPEKYLRAVLQSRVYEVAQETELQKAKSLSKHYKNNILIKREDLQPVFSFKLRGAYQKLVSLTDEERNRGIIASSAGNHAQGVALSAQKLGIKATIVMPNTTPEIKIKAVQAFKAKVIQKGDSYDVAFDEAQRLAKEKHLTFIPPYDDFNVIVGQGTIGMEIMRQLPQMPDVIFVPVGGGGLIAGIAAYIKTLNPEIKIIGVEPEDTPTLYAARKARRRVVLKEVGLFADGVAVRRIGKEPYRVAVSNGCVDDVILVSTDEICGAIKDIFEEMRIIAEPAGALAVAGIKKYITENKIKNKNLVGILSGANINFDRLRHVAERAEIGEQREALLAVRIPERPGSFKEFCRLLGKRNITEFNYRYADQHNAYVFCGVETRNLNEDPGELIKRLRKRQYQVTDLTENELAKLHIRYMVGGHALEVKNEKLYRFQFPERPGALLNFLMRIGKRWNISLFHYRNHGAAYGRVLIGIQLPDREQKDFTDSMEKLGYRYWDENDNIAYDYFVKPERI